MSTHKVIGQTYWLKHCSIWFAFDEPVFFKHDLASGGDFFSQSNGERKISAETNGFSEPSFDAIELQQICQKKDWWDRDYIDRAHKIKAISMHHSEILPPSSKRHRP